MPFTPYTFTSAQLVDIRRFCGYPAYGDGAVVFPFPWIMRYYLALEYRLQHISAVFDFALIVVHPFGPYQRGDRITDPSTITAVLASENIHHCNKVAR